MNRDVAHGDSFPIATDPATYFICGITSSQEQVLLGIKGDALLGLFFSKSGEFLRYEQRQPIYPLHDGVTAGAEQIQFNDMLQQQLDDWQTELRVITETIRVRQFFLPELDVGITGLPNTYMRRARGRRAMSQEERAAFDRSILEWEQEQRFVFWWNHELWMNRAGEITDT